MTRAASGFVDTTRASVRHRPHPWADQALRIMIGASAVVAGFGFTLLLIGAALLLDLFE